MTERITSGARSTLKAMIGSELETSRIRVTASAPVASGRPRSRRTTSGSFAAMRTKAVARAPDDGVMAEGGRRRPCRRIGVLRGGVAHDVLERDLRTPLPLEVVDPIDRHQRPRDVARDRVEDLELVTEALGTGRALDAEDTDDLLARAQRHADRLTGLWVASAETV